MPSSGRCIPGTSGVSPVRRAHSAPNPPHRHGDPFRFGPEGHHDRDPARFDAVSPGAVLELARATPPPRSTFSQSTVVSASASSSSFACLEYLKCPVRRISRISPLAAADPSGSSVTSVSLSRYLTNCQVRPRQEPRPPRTARVPCKHRGRRPPPIDFDAVEAAQGHRSPWAACDLVLAVSVRPPRVWLESQSRSRDGRGAPPHRYRFLSLPQVGVRAGVSSQTLASPGVGVQPVPGGGVVPT